MSRGRAREALTLEPATDDLRFLRALWELDHALESASRRMKSRIGVTGRERLLIRIIGERPAITPGELATVLHVHPSTVTALLKRLERRRLVLRRQAAEAARSSKLVLGAPGRAINALQSGTIEAEVMAALAEAPRERVIAAAELLVAVARRLARKAMG